MNSNERSVIVTGGAGGGIGLELPFCCLLGFGDVTLSPHPHFHLGRITVVPDPCGSLVTYEQELEPKALTYVLDGAVVDALNGLRDLVVDGRKSRSWVEPTIATSRGRST